jgi:hypothetical protein
MNIPFFSKLEKARTVLLVGAGGGFDLFTGLPIYHSLCNIGKTVHLANLSSGALGFCDAESPAPGVWRITPATAAQAYFPEMHLSRWLSERSVETPIYAIEPAGAHQVMEAYAWLNETLRPDTLILVDGGTDSLMRGDEVGLGTPEGDMASLLAAAGLSEIPRKFLVCLGFGVDSHHGVCHAHFLENVAALIGDDAYLGAWSLTREMEAFTFYRDACDFVFARLPRQPSIVNTSIIASVNGSFGNHHSTKRTEGSTLFINPLMGMYWSFNLEQVAQRNLVLDSIRHTQTFHELSMAIEDFRDKLPKLRPWKSIPC